MVTIQLTGGGPTANFDGTTAEEPVNQSVPRVGRGHWRNNRARKLIADVGDGFGGPVASVAPVATVTPVGPHANNDRRVGMPDDWACSSLQLPGLKVFAADGRRSMPLKEGIDHHPALGNWSIIDHLIDRLTRSARAARQGFS
jgi:hypothetical protein